MNALLAGDEAGVAGEHFTLAPGTALSYPRVREAVPLLIGTWGRETMRWAGTVADELKLGGSANPDFVPVAREWLANPAVKVVVGSVSVVDDDGDWARERARAAVEPYLGVVAHLDPTLGAARPATLRRSSASASPGRRRRSPRASCELWDAGADRVELGTPQGRSPLAGVEVICDRVLPLLRG